MRAINLDVPDDDYEWMRQRINADRTNASQVREAVAEYRAQTEKREAKAAALRNGEAQERSAAQGVKP